jgi:hypothetical protein
MKAILSAATVLLTCLAAAQDPLRTVATVGFGDVAMLKQKAASGDANAQVALANTLAGTFHSAEALQWYRKAAAQTNIEAAYQLGNLLLFGAIGIPNDQAVQPNPTEGIHWTFLAATNRHPNACRNMSKAFRNGVGVTTNLVEAYAWLQLFADSPSGSILGRVELNQLALKLDTLTIQQAQRLEAQFKAGNWKPPLARAIPEGDSRLKLNGITTGAKMFAVINGTTLAEGESTTIPGKPIPLKVKCLKIEKDNVLIIIEGEEAPRRLHLK